MTLPASGSISISQINTEIGKSASFSDDLRFLNGLITPGQSANAGTGSTAVASQRPATPNMNAFHGLTFYQSTNHGNCNNGNCGSSANCGNINCANCYGSECINCANCDTQSWLQSNCNCACKYNCTSNQVSHNCNCSKIICTKLYEFNLMSATIYQADQDFGKQLAQTDPDAYAGYRAWADVVVDWMEGSGPKMMPWMTDEDFSAAAKKWSTSWAHDIATPWAEEMAYLMGKKDQGSITGKLLMSAGLPICRAVGVWRRVLGSKQQSAGVLTGLALVMMFVGFKLLVLIGRTLESLNFKNRTI